MTGYLKSKMVFRDFYGNEMLLNHLWLLLRFYYHAVRLISRFSIDAMEDVSNQLRSRFVY